jgi:hypothetical protein
MHTTTQAGLVDVFRSAAQVTAAVRSFYARGCGTDTGTGA